MKKEDMAPGEPKAKERKVTVYNTVGSCQSEFQSSATNWGQLKKEFTTKGIPHTDMKAVLGENQVELKNDEDLLIVQDISVFMTPIKVRSGYARYYVI